MAKPSRSEVADLILNALRNLAAENPENANLVYDENVKLLGSRAVLDSIGFVTLLIDVEQGLSDQFEVFVTVADEKAMSQKNSPFRTVQTLIDYILELTEAQG